MGDIAEIHITPETPGRPAILNPFESPNDYHRLHEPLVPSPSVFKSSSATPAKFKWSIDEMANLLPVEIDPEDIHRQAVFLSQARADAEIEENRQHAIEQFFTKGAIVPSPWGPPAAKQSVKMPHQKSPLSPLVTEELQSSKKINAICQTVLSLPVDFNLEKVLGDYYRTEELTEQVQESLSSSSLRRKLFLDGHDSGSESSTPSSPDRYSHNVPPSSREMMSSVIVSPLQCGIPTGTPLSGQFSSSPIQGQCRAYSLGSVGSPMFSERSSPAFKSPILSPIRLQHSVTPVSGEKSEMVPGVFFLFFFYCCIYDYICKCRGSKHYLIIVDSGYNTHSVCTTSLMDTLSSDSQSKDMLDTHTAEEGVPFTRHTKPKLFILPH
ncbi:protein aurora borealis-like [Sinocyclocheilus rhinocerous]|uniref:protein aurora borealis-like n=1 Tax=Sinocyclocheilus rhinocerous TaxID=307959 RepID=UPI0007BA7011|nr:PREDICTED: protein aurora borealis-like [Sinocyclocheilus rhinocerous]